MKNLRRRLLPRRGSTLIIVLGVISLLVLLAVTLSFAAKLDTLSARNYQDFVQARVGVTTGVMRATRRLSAEMPRGATGSLDMALDPAFLARRKSLMAAAASTPGPVNATAEDLGELRVADASERLSLAPKLSGHGTEVSITDASGLLNVNTASPEAIASIFKYSAARAGKSFDANAFAERLAAWRLGDDGVRGVRPEPNGTTPAESTLEPTVEERAAQSMYGPAGDGTIFSLRQPTSETARSWDVARKDRIERGKKLFVEPVSEGRYRADIRRPAEGDDRRIADLADLHRLFGVPLEVLGQAAPRLTTFSVTEERFESGTASLPLLDLNRANAEEILERLRVIYAGTKDDRVLRQFAANVVDARDSDRVPTSLAAADGSDAVFGAERTPYLVEVYAQPRRIQLRTNDGQYVQIHNPWQESFDLSGWRLEGAGGGVSLSGTIPGNGYLIVTNDKDNSKDASLEETPGEGSFYDIFGRTSGGPGQRIIEATNLGLPSTAGSYEVRLVSRDGDIVDAFPYTVRSSEDFGLNAFKRSNPLVRDTMIGRATPFSIQMDSDDAAMSARSKLASYPADAPYTQLSELLGVFQGYAGTDGGLGRRWEFPALASPYSTNDAARAASADPGRLDARIMDGFTIETFERRPSETIEENLADADGDGRLNGTRRRTVWDSDATLFGAGAPADRNEEDWDRSMEEPIGLRHGLVNLNSAPAEVIRALPGLTEIQASRVLERRSASMTAAWTNASADGLAYRRPSELLCDDVLWSNLTASARVEAFEGLFDSVAFSSRSFLLVGRSKAGAESGADTPIASEFRVLVATDRGAPDYVAVSAIR